MSEKMERLREKSGAGGCLKTEKRNIFFMSHPAFSYTSWLMSHTLVIRGRASLPDIFGMAAFLAQRAIDMVCYCNAWSSGRLIVNLCQQMLEQQQAQSLPLSLARSLSLPCFASLLHLPTYLMNLICTAHWRLKLLVGSHLSHTHRQNPSLFYSARCFMWFTLFSSFWGTVLRKIRSRRQTQPGGFRRATSCQSQHAPQKGSGVRGSSGMMEDMCRDKITDLDLCEALMLKGALMHRCHVSYLATALIFALKITSFLTISELQLR